MNKILLESLFYKRKVNEKYIFKNLNLSLTALKNIVLKLFFVFVQKKGHWDIYYRHLLHLIFPTYCLFFCN